MLSEDQYIEILDDEYIVDKDQLMNAVRYGIPDSVRGRVWMLLLEVSSVSHQEEQENKEERRGYYNSIGQSVMPNIASAVNTVVRNKYYADASFNESVARILSKYFAYSPTVQFTTGMVYMTIPLLEASGVEETSAFYMFTSLISRLDEYYGKAIYRRQASKLSRYISFCFPELMNHFSTEALNTQELFVNWFMYLHSTAIPVKSVMRLWDLYLSLPVQSLYRDLLFVSLALIDRFHSKLLRMEHMQIKSFIANLPPIDMDIIICKSRWFAHQIQESAHMPDPEFE